MSRRHGATAANMASKRSPWAGLKGRPTLPLEALIIWVSVFFALACNQVFLAGLLAGRTWSSGATWVFAAAILVMLVAAHTVLLGLVLHRWYARALLSLLIVTTAFATYYMQTFGVFLDPTMARNVLRTDVGEARELFGWGMAPHFLFFAVLPLVALQRVSLQRRTWRRAVTARVAMLLSAVVVLVASLLLVFQDVSSLMRNQKELRYLITPANFVYSVGRVLAADTQGMNRPRAEVGADARLAASWQQRTKPALFVIMVGETARAANWGLNGYARQTTPELAALDVLNFPDVTACGTNTEISLPCMFSEIGRRDYDEDTIRNSQSLLHVLNRAGFKVLWRDNQSGCKGVCDGLPQEQLDNTTAPGLCADDHCFDEILLHGLDTVARDARGNLVLVMHMLGNHGPAYYKRYPDRFRRFTPTCDTAELRLCAPPDIVNAYDNALLYTDHVIAGTIAFLQRQAGAFDAGLIYISDHGESLGESGLYLHGVPYAIAPSEQTKVPMVWWLSPGFVSSFQLDRDCLARQAVQPATHDNLFHSVLGLLQVQTRAYDSALDVSAACRR